VFWIYLMCLIVGGGFLTFTLSMGDAGDHDVGPDLAEAGDLQSVGEAEVLRTSDKLWLPILYLKRWWLPLLSVRFWVFSVAFFGMTGVLVDGLNLAGPTGALVTSLLMGVSSGYAVAWVVQYLHREKVSSHVEEGDLVGKAGEVLLDVEPGRGGVVRISVKGITVDEDAVLVDPEGEALARRSKVIVVAHRDGKLLVAPFDTGEADRARGGREPVR
jgi:membrane protein implicated in regulation of membrane protease activity